MTQTIDGWLMRWNRINASDITSWNGWSDDEISFVTLSTGEKIMSFGADRGVAGPSGYVTFFVKFSPLGRLLRHSQDQGQSPASRSSPAIAIGATDDNERPDCPELPQTESCKFQSDVGAVSYQAVSA